MADKKIADVDPNLTFDTARELLTVPEAAVLLRRGLSTMYTLINAKAIPSVRLGRSISIPKAALVEYIERLSR